MCVNGFFIELPEDVVRLETRVANKRSEFATKTYKEAVYSFNNSFVVFVT